MKGNTDMSGGEDPSLAVHQTPVAFCSSSEDPSFLKFLIYNQKIVTFFEFCSSQSPLFVRISALYLNNFFKIAAL